jgi:hypothetical protein
MLVPDPSGGALLRRWQFKRLSTPPDMRAGWVRIDCDARGPSAFFVADGSAMIGLWRTGRFGRATPLGFRDILHR